MCYYTLLLMCFSDVYWLLPSKACIFQVSLQENNLNVLSIVLLESSVKADRGLRNKRCGFLNFKLSHFNLVILN